MRVENMPAYWDFLDFDVIIELFEADGALFLFEIIQFLIKLDILYYIHHGLEPLFLVPVLLLLVDLIPCMIDNCIVKSPLPHANPYYCYQAYTNEHRHKDKQDHGNHSE